MAHVGRFLLFLKYCENKAQGYLIASHPPRSLTEGIWVGLVKSHKISHSAQCAELLLHSKAGDSLLPLVFSSKAFFGQGI